jgi:glycine oxidase
MPAEGWRDALSFSFARVGSHDKRGNMRVRVIGAGVAGLTTAYECASRGAEVELIEREQGPGRGCSWYAGGMVAPWCELESAEPLVCQLGLEALDFWTRTIPVAQTRGSLVVAALRDLVAMREFARRACEFEEIRDNRIAELEPDLAGRFSRALLPRGSAS